MIRVVLAVALASALLGVGLPAAERVERDRNAAVATGELEGLAATAETLAARNDPVAPGEGPAATTVEVVPPTTTFTAGGRLLVDDDRLAWVPDAGPNRTVQVGVPLSVDAPLPVVERTRLRLSWVDTASGPVVRVEGARVQGGSRDHRRRATARPPPRRGPGLPV